MVGTVESRSRVHYMEGTLNTDLKIILGLAGAMIILGGHKPQKKAAKTKNPTGNGGSNGLYKSFHGSEPKIRRVDVPVPSPGEKLVAIGILERLEYKPYGSSARKGTKFYHVVGDTGDGMVASNPILASSENGKHLFIVPQHPKYPHMSDRGIIG